jgi:hypothetical protein
VIWPACGAWLPEPLKIVQTSLARFSPLLRSVRSSSASSRGRKRSAAVRRRTLRARFEVRFRRNDEIHMMLLLSRTGLRQSEDAIAAGAQTERWGGARPRRVPLGGETSPPAFSISRSQTDHPPPRFPRGELQGQLHMSNKRIGRCASCVLQIRASELSFITIISLIACWLLMHKNPYPLIDSANRDVDEFSTVIVKQKSTKMATMPSTAHFNIKLVFLAKIYHPCINGSKELPTKKVCCCRRCPSWKDRCDL